MEKEEDVFFGKFREHVKLVIDRVSQHQNGKHFDKAPARDNKEYKEYFKIAVEPLCLSDMRDKNAAKKSGASGLGGDARFCTARPLTHTRTQNGFSAHSS